MQKPLNENDHSRANICIGGGGSGENLGSTAEVHHYFHDYIIFLCLNKYELH